MLDPVYTFYVICDAIAAFVGLIFNGYILFVLICSTVSTSNVLLLFMALSDTTICLVILIFNTPMSFVHEVPVQIGDTAHAIDGSDSLVCKLQGSLWTVLPLCIIWTICALIVDRYISIIKPLRYTRLINVRKTASTLIAIWILLIIFAFPPLLGCCRYKFISSFTGCVVMCPRIDSDPFELYYITLYFLSLLLPLIVILFCNLHILIIARSQRHRIVSAIYEITMRAQATITHQRNPNYLLKYKGRDAFCTIFQLVGSLLFLTLPYFAVYAYTVFSDSLFYKSWTSAATFIFTLTPLVNGYTYGVKSKAIRKTFKRLLQRYLYEQQASIEIDRRLSLRSQSSLRESWNSFLLTSNISSHPLYRSQRRNSAPLTLTYVNVSTAKDSDVICLRRQSLENFNATHLKTNCDSCRTILNSLLRKSSLTTECKNNVNNNNNNKAALSPIQEISFAANSENSSVAVNAD